MKYCLSLFVLVAALALSSCGSMDNYVVADNAFKSVNVRYNFYYSQECDFDAFGDYGCYDVRSLIAPVMVVLKIDGSGFATLNFDGVRYSYYYDEYDNDFDYETGRYYYQFPVRENRITVYEDGSEVIYSYSSPLYDVHYYYDIY